jgi:signal transduction histidine kinase
VCDNGIGIPADAMPHLFERFFRVDKARSREAGGAGLGLSIVKSICMAHDGRVEAQSKEGGGSRFTVELPLAPATHGS